PNGPQQPAVNDQGGEAEQDGELSVHGGGGGRRIRVGGDYYMTAGRILKHPRNFDNASLTGCESWIAEVARLRGAAGEPECWRNSATSRRVKREPLWF